MAARVVCGSQPEAAARSSSVAPSGRETACPAGRPACPRVARVPPRGVHVCPGTASAVPVAGLRAFHANIGDGVGIHVYGPNGRSGQCGLGFRRGVRRLDPAVLKDFQWVCQLAHLRYCAMLVPTLGPLPELSIRETEVLAWVARGKSNSLIGEILGISSRTVDAHLRRIFLKLGVFDRISAAVRGIGVGVITAKLEAAQCLAARKGFSGAPRLSRNSRAIGLRDRNWEIGEPVIIRMLSDRSMGSSIGISRHKVVRR